MNAPPKTCCPLCKGSLAPPPNTTRMACPHCKKDICASCRVEWHVNSTCDKYQEWKRDNDMADQKFEELKKAQGWRQCPWCFVEVAKDGGCQWMRCSLCHNCFCWMGAASSVALRGSYAHVMTSVLFFALGMYGLNVATVGIGATPARFSASLLHEVLSVVRFLVHTVAVVFLLNKGVSTRVVGAVCLAASVDAVLVAAVLFGTVGPGVAESVDISSLSESARAFVERSWGCCFETVGEHTCQCAYSLHNTTRLCGGCERELSEESTMWFFFCETLLGIVFVLDVAMVCGTVLAAVWRRHRAKQQHMFEKLAGEFALEEL